jgi:two-component system phosphate regulon response regulator OmpR
MCIVVVDDEPELLDLVSSILEEEGYRVLAFGHPGSALQLRQAEERPALFLIDLMLPEMDGITLAARLSGFETTPKIAMSASPSMLQRARESECFVATLGKPFGIEELLESVERYRDVVA